MNFFTIFSVSWYNQLIKLITVYNYQLLFRDYYFNIIFNSICIIMAYFNEISIVVSRNIFYMILRNVLQCLVTIKVTLVAKSNIYMYHVLFCLYIMYRKMELKVIRQINYISYRFFIHVRKSIMD